MNIVGRIKLPKSAEVSGLYLQCNEAAAINSNPGVEEIVFCQGGMVSTNSYFNSFYENFYAKYTNLDSLYYWLRLVGDFQISVYREVYGQPNRELVFSQKCESCVATDFVKLKFPELNQGRIYFELMCLSEQGEFKEGLIATENPGKEVSLAIITCTYKKEAYIKKTVNTIVQDQLLATKSWKIFVVDNGKTLTAEDFNHSRVQFIPSRNVGGSGGFTRGLVEALQSKDYTHFLFMDDDIELDSESIYRLFALYEYALGDFAIAGAMIDLAKKYIIYEAGLLYTKEQKSDKFKPFSMVRLKHNLEINKPENLNRLLLDEAIDFGGFYFFAFSRQVVEKIGLLLPVFVKMDDLEFCLRLKQSVDIVSFPSISVWHETFFSKASLWDYYYYRNDLISHAIHKQLKYINAVSYFTKHLILSLLLFDYNHAEMLVQAFEDCVKGPNFIKTKDPELLHLEILELSKTHKTQSVQPNYSPSTDQMYDKTKAGSLKKIISLLTLNGHLLPDFLTSDEDVFLWQTPDYAGQRSKAFAKKRVLIFKEESNSLFQNEIDKKAGIKLLTRWLKVVVSNSVKWSSVCRQWKQASNDLFSIVFWQQYLGLEKPN